MLERRYVLFMQHLELASQLGYSSKKLESERMLRDAQLGFMGNEVFRKTHSSLGRDGGRV